MNEIKNLQKLSLRNEKRVKGT